MSTSPSPRQRSVKASWRRLAGCTCSDDPCPHFETWRRRGQPGTKPRQNDYLYVTTDLVPRLHKIEVLPIDLALSEHSPIVTDLELELCVNSAPASLPERAAAHHSQATNE